METWRLEDPSWERTVVVASDLMNVNPDVVVHVLRDYSDYRLFMTAVDGVTVRETIRDETFLTWALDARADHISELVAMRDVSPSRMPSADSTVLQLEWHVDWQRVNHNLPNIESDYGSFAVQVEPGGTRVIYTRTVGYPRDQSLRPITDLFLRDTSNVLQRLREVVGAR
jgi:hypothetical protein